MIVARSHACVMYSIYHDTHRVRTTVKYDRDSRVPVDPTHLDPPRPDWREDLRMRAPHTVYTRQRDVVGRTWRNDDGPRRTGGVQYDRMIVIRLKGLGGAVNGLLKYRRTHTY